MKAVVLSSYWYSEKGITTHLCRLSYTGINAFLLAINLQKGVSHTSIKLIKTLFSVGGRFKKSSIS